MSAYVSVRGRASSVAELADFAAIASALGVPVDQNLAISEPGRLEVVVPHGPLIARLEAARPADAVGVPARETEAGGWELTSLDDDLTLIHFAPPADGWVVLVCGHARCLDGASELEVWRGLEADFASALSAVLSHVRTHSKGR